MSESKKLYCAPNKNKNTFTCYTKQDLLILIKSYNKNKSKEHHIITNNKSKKDLWLELNNKMKKDCNNEWCWLEKNFVPAPYTNNIKKSFRPEMPQEWNENPFEWLSNFDIKDVMKQYEKKYPNFLFIGPVPSDCPSKITCALSGLSVDILINRLGKTKLGIIFNLDTHNKPGSHWIATFFDFKKGEIIYFDSVGLPPPKMIKNFLEKMKKSCEDYYLHNFDYQKKVNIYVNKTQFQFGNTECGVFSMYFIISNLSGKNIKKLDPKKVNDKLMNELRKEYFRPNN